MKHIHTLTGLRGFAALVVLISHAANEGLFPSYFGKGFGQIGVMIFFVLSGFLMTHLYVHEDFNLTNVKKYALARVGRVFPLYFSLIFISVIITAFIHKDFPYYFELDKLIRAVALIDAPYVFWTIPVEVQFYVIFVGFWFLIKRKVNTMVLVVYVLATFLPSIYIYVNYLAIPKIASLYSYSFFLGVSTALFYSSLINNKRLEKVAAIVGIPLVVLLFINLPVLREQYGLIYSQNSYLRTWGDPISWLLVYMLFVCAVINSKSVAFLNWAPFVFLGNISYGFYLMHYPIVIYVKKLDINPVFSLVLIIILTLSISYLSYRYFEKPVGRKIRSLQAV